MSEEKWPEGPYVIGQFAGENELEITTEERIGEYVPLAVIGSGWMGHIGEENRAVAHLFKAAPEMYGAIKWALGVFEPSTPEHAAILEAMHAVLEKARGE